MSILSVAQATRRLGIDAKTLHRWLAEAALAVQSHPSDGRKKGVSSDDLQTLARLHQRSLTPFSSEPPAPDATERLSWPTTLLALPEQLAALHAQVAALQAEVATLTRLCQHHAAAPASPQTPRTSSRTSKRSSPSASPASRSRRAAAVTTPPHKPIHVIPRVEWDGAGGYVVICPKKGRLALTPDSPEWFDWLRTQSSFRFVGKMGHFSAHHEWRVPRGAWRAYRHIRNHNHILRLAPNQELTIAVLEQAAAALQAHLQ